MVHKKKVSRLFQECIDDDCACCGKVSKPVFFPSEIEILADSGNLPNFNICENNAVSKSVCCFLNEYYCSIYEKRPIDCRSYPLSVKVENEEAYFVLDMECPAVQKGIITNEYIESAKKLWKDKNLNINWLKEYGSEEDTKKHNWVSIEGYKVYRHSLKNKRK